MVKQLLISLCFSFTLIACSFDGFRPPRNYYSWLHDGYSARDFLSSRRQDMIDCGMDWVDGESGSAKVNLCMESKGWYSNKSPVCEDKVMDSVYSDPLCIQWRAKHHKK